MTSMDNTIFDYLIISPCRNEADYVKKTLNSVIAQSIQPKLWVIVDDGSTDETPAILAEYALNHSFIKIVTRTDRGHRSVGPGVIEAFYAGYDTVDLSAFDFICKLDLDLIMPPNYFEILIQRMQENPRLGNCSGKPYFVDSNSGKLISEGCGDENAIGASKFYRRQCFEQIGGFIRQVMWDGIDGHRCRQLGWIAVSWDEPGLRFTHLRPMGSSQQSIITGRMRHGFGQYFMGTGLIYMLASSVYRMAHPPYVIGGMAMFWGYLSSLLKGLPRFDDEELVKFIRKYQWACLFKGKSKATAELNAKQAAAWKG
jgi:poly-beta-1,6-N-acetyl-D-glucosamine synthase